MIKISGKRLRFRIIIPAYPAFNIYSRMADRTTTLGAVTIASVVKERPGWDVEVIDENNLRWFGPRGTARGADHKFLQGERPAQVIGLYGGLTSTIPRLYQLAQFYKNTNKDIITITGGQHFVKETIPEALRSGIDYVVRHEGEETVRELLDVLEAGGDAGSVKGIAYLKNGQVVFTPERDLLSEFEHLPLPDFSLVRYAKIKIYPVGRIRGCGMNCEFCTVKGKPRCASPERLLEQISHIVETRGAGHFFIVDDLFGQQRSETMRFCRMLKSYQQRIKKRIDTVVQIRLDKSKDTELLGAMREAGVNMVAIGYESPIAEELEAMRKKIKPEDMIAMTRVFHKFGFLVHGMFIFGYPVQEGAAFHMPVRERIKRYKRFIHKARIDTLQVLLPVPLPGTELRERLMKSNRIYPLSDVGWEYYDGNFPLFEPDEPMTAEEVLWAERTLMKGFYQFRYMFKIGLNVFFFPALLFYLSNIRSGWRKWYRPWRNDLVRFSGWFIVKGWGEAYKKDMFAKKLKKAKQHLKNS
ncbi:MAG: B12-binding domain-containing radical SAM protein [Candidatus Omnitrophica bacterium]|nr:B12-binding domain-containing radical SAM protein [Candidatus Omnitrophota bacterium]